MDQFFKNPGLSHIGRNILEELGLSNLPVAENPTFWLKTCIKEASKRHEAPPEEDFLSRGGFEPIFFNIIIVFYKNSKI